MREAKLPAYKARVRPAYRVREAVRKEARNWRAQRLAMYRLCGIDDPVKFEADLAERRSLRRAALAAAREGCQREALPQVAWLPPRR